MKPWPFFSLGCTCGGTYCTLPQAQRFWITWTFICFPWKHSKYIRQEVNYTANEQHSNEHSKCTRELSSMVELMWCSLDALEVVKMEIGSQLEGNFRRESHHNILCRHDKPCGPLLWASFNLQQYNEPIFNYCKNAGKYNTYISQAGPAPPPGRLLRSWKGWRRSRAHTADQSWDHILHAPHPGKCFAYSLMS